MLIAIIGYHESEKPFGSDVRKYYEKIYGKGYTFISPDRGAINNHVEDEIRVTQYLNDILSIMKPQIVVDLHCDTIIAKGYKEYESQFPHILIYNHGIMPPHFHSLDSGRIITKEDTISEKYALKAPISLAIETMCEYGPYDKCVRMTAFALHSIRRLYSTYEKTAHAHPQKI